MFFTTTIPLCPNQSVLSSAHCLFTSLSADATHLSFLALLACVLNCHRGGQAKECLLLHQALEIPPHLQVSRKCQPRWYRAPTKTNRSLPLMVPRRCHGLLPEVRAPGHLSQINYVFYVCPDLGREDPAYKQSRVMGAGNMVSALNSLHSLLLLLLLGCHSSPQRRI